MTQSIGQIKAAAGRDMRAASPNARWMTFVYLLVTAGLSYGVGMFVADPILELMQMYQSGLALDRAILLALQAVGGTGLFLNLVVMLTGIVFDFGYSQWCLGTTRGGIGELSDLLGGFQMTGRVLLLRLATLLYCFMWYIIIFMPALVVVLVGVSLPLMGPVLAITAFMGAAALFILRILGYAMAPYCLMDEPEGGVIRALRTSQQLMRGRVGRLILLLLSFVGWQMLAMGVSLTIEVLILLAGEVLIPVLGLGAGVASLLGKGAALVGSLAAWPLYLWLTPYMTMTQCRFYDALRAGQKNT